MVLRGKAEGNCCNVPVCCDGHPAKPEAWMFWVGLTDVSINFATADAT